MMMELEGNNTHQRHQSVIYTNTRKITTTPIEPQAWSEQPSERSPHLLAVSGSGDGEQHQQQCRPCIFPHFYQYLLLVLLLSALTTTQRRRRVE